MSINRKMNKPVLVHSHDFILYINNKKRTSDNITTWINFTKVMLSERS